MKLLGMIYGTEHDLFNAINDLRKKDGKNRMSHLVVWLSEHSGLYRGVVLSQRSSVEKELPDEIGKRSLQAIFISAYEVLQRLTSIFTKERFFQQEYDRYLRIKDNKLEVEKWLNEHKDMALEDLWDFWMEWVEEDKQIVCPFILYWEGAPIQVPLEDLENTMKFTKAFHHEYWNGS